MSEKKFISGSGESSWKMLKDEACFILIIFEFPELENKSCKLNIGNNDKSLKVHVIRNLKEFY